MSVRRGRRIVIGIGNPDRGDDAAGLVVARALRDRLPDGVEVLEHDGEATRLLERMADAEAVFLIDAAVSGAPAGTIRRFDAHDGPLPQALFGMPSSHGFGLAEAVELARALGRLPPCCIVHAIEGGTFETGADLSPEVAAAANEVSARIAAEISRMPAALPG